MTVKDQIYETLFLHKKDELIAEGIKTLDEKLAENNLGEYTLASPAVSGRALFIRTESHLYRIEELQ